MRCVTWVDWVRVAGLACLRKAEESDDSTESVLDAGRLVVKEMQVSARVASGVFAPDEFDRDTPQEELEQKYLPYLGFIWAFHGFPSVVVGHRHAASLMSTSVSEDLSDVFMPWPSMLLRCPEGLVTEDTVPILVGCNPPHAEALFLLNGRWVYWNSPRGLTGFAEAARQESDTSERRAMELVARLLVGVSLEMQTAPQPPAGARAKSQVARMRRGKEPRAWTFRLARNVVVDCRPAVRAYVEHGGRHPTVQSLVRGHHKRQPCGPGGTARKWIHVEPYWRGPEDAPIAVRSHVLGEP